ncbi:transcriptional regulator [Streptomyces sp. NPDC056660]|uniref:transcriptional regulator n=1 Tax=Streptomyces sp. NPDC056660 TaxID=3345897 RepID=UPI0036892DE4
MGGVAEWAEFGWVREASGLSASALSQQVGTLGSHGYVEVEKGYVGKRPRTRRHGSTPSKRQAYADRLTDRQRLLLRLQACAASGDTAVRDAVRDLRIAVVGGRRALRCGRRPSQDAARAGRAHQCARALDIDGIAAQGASTGSTPPGPRQRAGSWNSGPPDPPQPGVSWHPAVAGALRRRRAISVMTASATTNHE